MNGKTIEYSQYGIPIDALNELIEAFKNGAENKKAIIFMPRHNGFEVIEENATVLELWLKYSSMGAIRPMGMCVGEPKANGALMMSGVGVRAEQFPTVYVVDNEKPSPIDSFKRVPNELISPICFHHVIPAESGKEKRRKRRANERKGK